jgi:putative transposase
VSEGEKASPSWKVRERLEQIIHQVADEQIVKRIKGGSSNILRRELPELLKLPSLWTHSYHVSTIGTVSKENIEKYIEVQKGV